jgi:hypothetical protein
VDFSRRQILGGMAGIGGVLLLPESRPRSALTGPLPFKGATVNPVGYGLPSGDWPRAAQRYNGYVGMPLAAGAATSAQKVYYQRGNIPATVSEHIMSLTRAECHLILCIFPDPATDQRAQLAAYLHALTAAGVSYEVCLANEWNGAAGHNFTPAEYQTYWAFYAPTVQAAGVPCGVMVVVTLIVTNYDKIIPGLELSPLPDALWMDYYATAYRAKVRLDPIIAAAQSLGIARLGIGETNIATTNYAPSKVPTIAQWDASCAYIAARATELTAGCLAWDGYSGSVNPGVDVIASSSDPRIPALRQLMAAF